MDTTILLPDRSPKALGLKAKTLIGILFLYLNVYSAQLKKNENTLLHQEMKIKFNF